MMNKVEALGFSNIALIKYMGKDLDGYPLNSSLSYRLDNYFTKVTAEKISGKEDKWEPLKESGFSVDLSDRGQKRFLDFWKLLKKEFLIQDTFLLSSANNFPSDCGLASSASSFSALVHLAQDVAVSTIPEQKLLQVARQGSGSGVRSLKPGWSLWDGKSLESRSYLPLNYHCEVVAQEKKEVSSSEAHQRVVSTPFFQGRTSRAQKRLERLEFILEEITQSFNGSLWEEGFWIVWNEFWDMHSLFLDGGFSYFTSDTHRVLARTLQLLKEKRAFPWVTLDAGANVHFLWPSHWEGPQSFLDFDL